MTIRAEITRTFEGKEPLLASAAIIFDENFIVKNLRVIDGTKGRFVVMPNFKGDNGRFRGSPLQKHQRLGRKYRTFCAQSNG
jgi:DNA-binding cell septation regulator SpoVG